MEHGDHPLAFHRPDLCDNPCALGKEFVFLRSREMMHAPPIAMIRVVQCADRGDMSFCFFGGPDIRMSCDFRRPQQDRAFDDEDARCNFPSFHSAFLFDLRCFAIIPVHATTADVIPSQTVSPLRHQIDDRSVVTQCRRNQDGMRWHVHVLRFCGHGSGGPQYYSSEGGNASVS